MAKSKDSCPKKAPIIKRCYWADRCATVRRLERMMRRCAEGICKLDEPRPCEPIVLEAAAIAKRKAGR